MEFSADNAWRIQKSNSMLKIGHRGACGYAPENTLASFQKALDLGCDAVELDVHLCASGEAMVIHDETLERTTNGHGRVADHTLTELQELDAGNGERISTLVEVLAFINRRMRVFIELKMNAAHEVADIIEAHVKEHGWGYADLPVLSFNRAALAEIQSINPAILTAPGFEEAPDSFDGIAALSISKEAVSASIVAQAHQYRLPVYVWTVNMPDDIARIKALGVDGIMSDFPDRLA